MIPLSHWSLSRLPFGPPRRTGDFFAGSPQREALARLEYLVTYGRPTALIAGPQSVGRTALLQYVAGHCWEVSAQQKVIWVEPANQPLEIIDQVSSLLGLQHVPATWRWRAICDETATAARGGARTVLVVDDAELAGEESLRTLSRLIGACPAMSMIVACRSDRAERVSDQIGGCPLRVELSGWSLPEIRDYLQHGLTTAGCTQSVFSDQGIIRLLELSDGLPGIIARLAELALLTGASCRAQRVGPELIEAAANELLLQVPFANAG
jgi:type II secretory pathway predicted ATPase ExeA